MSRGSFSFVAMLVINPIVILFYQNCSMSPISHASNTSTPPKIERAVASEAKPTILASDKSCDETKKACPKTE